MAEPSASEPVEQGERAVAFVDLAGFTALTEAHGDEEAVGLVERFTAITRAALGDGDQFIKSIGDAVMLTSSTPEAALALVQQLFEGCYRESDFPLPRAGIHAGRVIARGDDVFGGTVNLAARVAAQAFGGQVLATAKVADAARTMNITTIDLGNLNCATSPSQ
jgi:adenylate cyclase